MRKLVALVTTISLLAVTSRAAMVTGFVLCDANQNGGLDDGDVGLANVLVVITNQTGSFSNAAFTGPDGSFSVQIPDFDPLVERMNPLAQVYVETLDPATLPEDATILFPLPITFISPTPAYYIGFAADLTNVTFTSGSGSTPDGDWLIQSSVCVPFHCRISGGGTVRGSSRKPEHSLAGNVFSTSNGDVRGRWTDIAHHLRLRFESTVIDSIICGGSSPADNSTFDAITIFGQGTLKGISGNKVRHDSVLFTVHAQDLGKAGDDLYYLRVYTAGGTTLLLVSGDPGNPANVVPVPISSGNLRVRATSR